MENKDLRPVVEAILYASGAPVELARLEGTLDAPRKVLLEVLDEIKEEYLFETGNGYRTALNGIYRKLATFDLYGSNLSWGLIDGWGLVYNLDKAPDDGGGRAMKKIATFCLELHY